MSDSRQRLADHFEAGQADLELLLRARGRDPDQHEIMDFSTSPTWSEVASQFKLGRGGYLPQLTHFMPMQAPDLVAGYIREGVSSPSTGMARGVPE